MSGEGSKDMCLEVKYSGSQIWSEFYGSCGCGAKKEIQSHNLPRIKNLEFFMRFTIFPDTEIRNYCLTPYAPPVPFRRAPPAMFSWQMQSPGL